MKLAPAYRQPHPRRVAFPLAERQPQPRRVTFALADDRWTHRRRVRLALADDRWTHRRRVRLARLTLVLALVLVSTAAARADAPSGRSRAVHGSIGVGSTLALTAHDGNRLRYELEVDIKPGSRYGGFVAWRGFDGEHSGMLLGGLIFEAAAARPRLVLDLHADVGADLDQKAPVIGGGVRTTLTIYKLIGIAFDSGAYLVIDGIENTRLRLMGSTSLVVRW